MGAEQARHVFEKQVRCLALICDVKDVVEESTSFSFKTDLLSCNGEVLAREASNDEVNHASKVSDGDLGEIAAPHSRWLQSSRFHERNKLACCGCFPFSVQNVAQFNAQVS
jgi:hypothetical protein